MIAGSKSCINMGLTKQYLRYASAGKFNIISSSNCNVVFVTLEGQLGRYVAVGACEDVIVWDMRLGEKVRHFNLSWSMAGGGGGIVSMIMQIICSEPFFFSNGAEVNKILLYFKYMKINIFNNLILNTLLAAANHLTYQKFNFFKVHENQILNNLILPSLPTKASRLTCPLFEGFL